MLFVPTTPRASFCIKYDSSFVHFEEDMNASASAPFCAIFSLNLSSIKFNASSHSASLNESPSRISGFSRRSSLLTKSQPNLPLTQVETPFAGASTDGSTFNISRSFVHTSKEHPTPQ